MNIRKLIIDPEAEKYYGFAVQKFQQLEQQRAAINAPMLSKTIAVNGVFMLLKTSALSKKIIMWVGRAVPHILLINDADVQAYNYYKDKYSSVPFQDSLSGFSFDPYDLFPIYNGRSQVRELAEFTYDKGWSSSAIESTVATTGGYLGSVNRYEVVFVGSGGSISARVGDRLTPFIEIDNISTFPAGAQQSSLGVIREIPHEVPPWNNYWGPDMVTVSPAGGAAPLTWQWVPNFHTVAPALGYKPGWFYGKYLASEYDAFEPLESAIVQFKGIIDCRHTAGEYQYGYAEEVYSIDGEDKRDIFFYLQDSPLGLTGNSTNYYQRVTTVRSQAYATMGSDLQGRDKTFKIGLDVDWAVIRVRMWNLASFVQPDSLDADTGAVGICFSEEFLQGQFVPANVPAKFYRYRGYLSPVYETDNYHSHSYSRDGRILAIFLGTYQQGPIERVVVIDLFGERAPSRNVDGVAFYDDPAEYIGGGHTILQDSAVVSDIEAMSACVIPHRASPDTVPPGIYTGDPRVAEENDTLLTAPAFATASFRVDGVSPVLSQYLIWEPQPGFEYKHTVTLSKFEDPCFASKFMVENTDDDTNILARTNLVGSQTFPKGKFRMSRVVNGVFSPLEGEGLEITLPETFTIGMYEDGGVYIEGYVGDLTLGDCIVENVDGSYDVDPDCVGVASCSGESTLDMTATSSCGQTATREIPGVLPTAITISGSEYAFEGDEYIISGGVGPYTATFAGGDSSVTDNIITIGVVDACISVWAALSGTTYAVPVDWGYAAGVGTLFPTLDSGTTDIFGVPVQADVTFSSGNPSATSGKIYAIVPGFDPSDTGKRFSGSAGVWFQLRFYYTGGSPQIGAFTVWQASSYGCYQAIEVEDSCTPPNTATLYVHAVPSSGSGGPPIP